MIDTDQEVLTGQLITSSEDEQLTAKDKRNPPGMIDEYYIECYLENPSNKAAALRKAVQMAGGKGDISRNRAVGMHRRLKRRIDKGLLRRMADGGTLGYNVTYSLASNEEINPAVRLKAAENLMLYAGKSKPELIEAEKADRIDLKAEIAATRQRIEELTGETIN